jgi:heme/copper-type cytochrome/quinol oxidase subunit 2
MNCNEAIPGVATKIKVIAILLAALAPADALAEREYNLQTPATPIASQIYDLHTYIMWICVVNSSACFR